MAQHDYDIANGSGAVVRADINTMASAIVTQNSGASAPSPTFANMLWADTSNNLLKQRDTTNASWITVGTLNATNLGLLALTGGTLTGTTSMGSGVFNFCQGADIASASTVNLETATGNTMDVTGTTTINVVTLSQGHWRMARFTGTCTITNGTGLVCSGFADIQTENGDYVLFIGYASTVRAIYFPVNQTVIKQKSISAAYTLLRSDVNRPALYHPTSDTSARIWTIPPNGSVAFPVNQPMTFINGSGAAGVITITPGAGVTLVLCGTTPATGARTLAASNMATAIQVVADVWLISGTGGLT